MPNIIDTEAVMEPSGQMARPENDEIGFFDGIHSGDFIEIERIAPWGHDGYMGTVPFEAGIDIPEELKRLYGGGTYRLKRKRRVAGGKIVYSQGTVTKKVAGEPKDPAANALAVQQAAAIAPMGSVPAVNADLIARQIVEHLKLPAEQLEGIASQIRGAIGTGQQAAVNFATNPVDAVKQAAEMYKSLKGLFGREERQRNPAPDDDEEDEEGDDGEDYSDKGLMGMFGKMFLSHMMGQQQAQQNPAPAGDAPPGWRKGPQGWERAPQRPQGYVYGNPEYERRQREDEIQRQAYWEQKAKDEALKRARHEFVQRANPGSQNNARRQNPTVSRHASNPPSGMDHQKDRGGRFTGSTQSGASQAGQQNVPPPVNISTAVDLWPHLPVTHSIAADRPQSDAVEGPQEPASIVRENPAMQCPCGSFDLQRNADGGWDCQACGDWLGPRRENPAMLRDGVDPCPTCKGLGSLVDDGDSDGTEDETGECPDCLGSKRYMDPKTRDAILEADESVAQLKREPNPFEDEGDEDGDERVMLDEATPEAIADEIANMDEEEQVETIKALADSFGMDKEVIAELFLQAKKEKDNGGA